MAKAYRQHIAEILMQELQIHKQLRVGVEHGVWKGKTSEYLLKRFPMLHLFGVDSYQPDQDYLDTGDPVAKSTPNEFQAAKHETFKRIKPYEERFHLFNSKELVPSIKADFVFIDGNHAEAAVKMDSLYWYNRVKVKGLLLWHDYGSTAEWATGVKPAVDWFCKTYSLQLESVSHQVAWITKPYTSGSIQ